MNPITPAPQRPQPAEFAFRCSICEEASTRVCAWCTKDACDNHLCPECQRCSDCCECQAERRSK